MRNGSVMMKDRTTWRALNTSSICIDGAINFPGHFDENAKQETYSGNELDTIIIECGPELAEKSDVIRNLNFKISILEFTNKCCELIRVEFSLIGSTSIVWSCFSSCNRFPIFNITCKWAAVGKAKYSRLDFTGVCCNNVPVLHLDASYIFLSVQQSRPRFYHRKRNIWFVLRNNR